MFDQLEGVEQRHSEISHEMSQPEVASNPAHYQKLTRELHGLEEIVTTRSTARMKEYNDRRSALDFRSLARHLQAVPALVALP